MSKDRHDSARPGALAHTGENRWRQVAQQHYQPTQDEELTTTIIYALADAENVSPTALKSPPLYRTFDVESLPPTFFDESGASGSREGPSSVTFRYREYVVAVRSDGWIQVYAPRDSGQAETL
ncbi:MULTISPECIES: HalOD1 output domain-containing protein [Salinibaculum]|uniref:HalOD1 output domain-containing protein n=1 Tax=Salinibaculum TaxID=2732368 RepID=UPI0030CACE56